MSERSYPSMPRPDLLASLVAFTGDLRPSPETTGAELTDLRRAILQSLDPGLAAASAQAVATSVADAQLLAELTYLISTHRDAPGGSDPVQIVRRESPVRIVGDPSIPEWAAALAPTRTFGPFLDRDGNFVW